MAQAADTQDPSRLVSDAPGDFDTEPDAFGHSDYAAVLADLMQRAPTPFTAGIFGPWGLGKSTIVREMGRRLPGDRCVLVEFDAWRHEGQALRRHFLKQVANELEEAGCLQSFRPDRELSEMDADVSEARAFLQVTVARVARALLPALVLGIGVLVFAALVTTSDVETQARETPWAMAAIFVATATFVGTLASTLLGESQRTTTVKRLDEPDRFTEKFLELLADVKPAPDGRPRRIVVAIDNLDRCSPDRAVEILGTVKTYLETSAAESAGADAVFVIAVDDAALRRHLLAKEYAESAVLDAPPEHAEPEPDRSERAHDAAEDVDEYLRKFFSVTLRVRDLLDDDMREYTRRYLEPTIAFWLARAGQPAEAVLQAVEMTSNALGRNPRRIKQFVNTFEARMSLIAQREAPDEGPPRINPPISKDPLLVAELMLLEEKWDQYYAKLERRPESLEEWHRWAVWEVDVTSDWEEGLDPPDPAVLKDPDWPYLAQFLRLSPAPGDTDLGPFLRLKQTSAELELELLPEVLVAIRSGRRESVAELLEGRPRDERMAYLREIQRQNARDRSAGYAAAAAQVVCNALVSPAFDDLGEVLGEMLTDGLKSPGMSRNELLDRDPELLLRHIEGFRPEDARLLMSVLGEGWDFLPAARRAEWPTVLAGRLAAMPAEARSVVGDMLAHNMLVSLDPMFRMVLEQNPQLAPDAAVAALVELLRTPPASEADEERQLKEVESRTRALWLLPIAVDAGKVSPESAEELLRVLVHHIWTWRAVSNISALLSEATPVAERLQLREPAVTDMSLTLREAWPQLFRDAPVAMLWLLRAIVHGQPPTGPWAAGWFDSLRSGDFSVYAAAKFLADALPTDTSPLVPIVADALADLPDQVADEMTLNFAERVLERYRAERREGEG